MLGAGFVQASFCAMGALYGETYMRQEFLHDRVGMLAL